VSAGLGDGEKSFPASSGKLVRVAVRSLDVVVRVSEGNEVKVLYDLKAGSSSPGAARRWVERNTPEFDDSESELIVRTPKRSGVVVSIGYFHGKGRLELAVPAKCRLIVETTSGDVAIGGKPALEGPVKIVTTSGDVDVRGGVRELEVDSTSGEVTVRGDELDRFEVETSSGDVLLESGARVAEAETSSGEIRLSGLGGGLRADSRSGDIIASWDTLPSGERVHVSTTSGDVTLRIPSGTALGGELRSRSGNVRSMFEGTSTKRERSLQFTAREGAAMLDVRASSGDVELLTR
jgi:DUF4097 and DUF4098 domain-containing protein YvlB